MVIPIDIFSHASILPSLASQSNTKIFHTWILFKCLWLIKWTMIVYLGHLQEMVHQDKLHKDQLFWPN